MSCKLTDSVLIAGLDAGDFAVQKASVLKEVHMLPFALDGIVNCIQLAMLVLEAAASFKSNINV